ncbi:MAG TPA: DUF86 domain-containing protein [Candidatus Deferrimicrobium sp.]|nr:DUF86 domain-containing protein [Candidatus Deferrimicrobium sp.]
MFDQEGIIDHILELEQAILDWERYQEITLEELKKDRDKKNMVLHVLLISIQATIDIANHLIAAQKLTRPLTYRESFEILSDAKLIPSPLANQLADLAGFRNLLVHIYWRLDIENVHKIIQNDLIFVKKYLTLIKSLIKGKEKNH